MKEGTVIGEQQIIIGEVLHLWKKIKKKNTLFDSLVFLDENNT